MRFLWFHCLVFVFHTVKYISHTVVFISHTVGQRKYPVISIFTQGCLKKMIRTNQNKKSTKIFMKSPYLQNIFLPSDINIYTNLYFY